MTSPADSITWADYWSAQKPGSSGSYSDLYRKISCCQSLGDDDSAWAGATDCVCRRIVKYRTIHACGLSAACTAAARDIKNAITKITAFTKKSVTQACSTALNDAICSYHFWGCSDNFPEEVYNNVCLDVCQALETSCRWTISRASLVYVAFYAFRSQFGFDVTLSNFTRGMYYHRGCKGFNGTFAQDCTRPSLAEQRVLHPATAAVALLVLVAL